MRVLLPIPLCLAALGLQSCADHQYLAIPQANAEGNITENMQERPAVTGEQRPAITVLTGVPGLVVGQSVKLHVDLGPVTGLDPTQLMLLAVNQEGLFYGYWELDLSEAERAAHAVDVEAFALAEAPTKEFCQANGRGGGECANEVDKGVTAFTTVPSTKTSAGWPGTTVKLTLPPLATGSSECTFTLAACCTGSGGISVVQCAVAQSYIDDCDCPKGTTSLGPHGDGTTHCQCP